MRASGPVDAAPIDVLRTMSPPEFKPEWDLNNEESYIVKKIGANAFIHYKKIKKIIVISSRDMITNLIMNQEPDGSVVTVASSLNCKQEQPETDGVIRASVILAG